MKNPSRPPFLALAALASLLALSGCSSVPVIGRDKKPEPTLDFVAHVKPILEGRCLRCHSGTEAARGLNYETLKTANESWRGGPVIIPGQPNRSMTYQVIRLDVDTPARLLGSQPHVLSYNEREKLRIWIEEGASWPSDLPPLVAR